MKDIEALTIIVCGILSGVFLVSLMKLVVSATKACNAFTTYLGADHNVDIVWHDPRIQKSSETRKA